MSIATKLQKILDSKAAIKAAIAGKGGTITDATPLDEYAQAVQSIPSGDDSMLKDLIENDIVELDIPNGTTKIAIAIATTTLTKVVMPNTITSVGAWAFSQCSNLADVTYSNNIISMGNGAFYACHRFASVVLPDTVETLGAECYKYCDLLQDVVLGSNITSIGNSAFFQRRYRITMRISATTPPTLGTTAFAAAFLNKIYVPDASVNDYKTASNWSAYASYIYPLSDYTP